MAVKSAKKMSKKSVKAPKMKKAGKAKAMKAKAPAKKALSVGKKPLSKSEVMTHLADVADVKRKQVSVIMDSLFDVIKAHVDKKGPGEFNFPGLMKIRVVRKPATKARKGVNPFTGEEIMIKAKPARNVVKIRPLKKLKEVVN